MSSVRTERGSGAASGRADADQGDRSCVEVLEKHRGQSDRVQAAVARNSRPSEARATEVHRQAHRGDVSRLSTIADASGIHGIDDEATQGGSVDAHRLGGDQQVGVSVQDRGSTTHLEDTNRLMDHTGVRPTASAGGFRAVGRFPVRHSGPFPESGAEVGIWPGSRDSALLPLVCHLLRDRGLYPIVANDRQQ
jgi:hypothetical protein